MAREIKINVYRSNGEWFGARWIDGEYDGCDELPIEGDADTGAAIACAESMPIAATGPRVVSRVDDPR